MERPNLRDKAELIIGIGNWCNYDCSYCMPHSKARNMQLGEAQPIIDIIFNSYYHFRHYAKVSTYGVLFVGGEPTIHPQFNKVIDEIQPLRQIEPNYKIIIVTNLSRTERWWTKIAPKVTGLVASYHNEHTTPKEFADKLILCLQANPHLYVTVGIQPMPGMIPMLWEHAEEIRRRVSAVIDQQQVDSHLDFIIQHLYLDNDKLYPYSEEDFQQFKDMIAEFSNPQIPMIERLSNQDEFLTHSFTMDDQYLGSSCYAGLEGLTVGFNGKLTRTARCGLSKEINQLGNIYTGYTLPTEPALCDVPKGCGNCWFDYAFRKTK